MRKQDISTFFTSLHNLHSSQQFLENCYTTIGEREPESKSYENSGTLMYYLDQGELFLQEGRKADVRLQPLLYFYGMVHLLKACLLTNRPGYPESTSILAHGVTARKRKKKDYTFIHDEVKIQQNGLFSYACNHLFSMKHAPFQKIKMEFLLGLIPEMNDLFVHSNHEKTVEVGEIGSSLLQFPVTILDRFHLTERAFIQRIQTHLSNIKKTETTDGSLIVTLEKPVQQMNGPFYCHQEKQTIYFPLERTYFVTIPEILIHYLLLYNLSMISRYETEFWGELFATKHGLDYSVIAHYLTIVADKIEVLLGEWLINKVN